VYKRIVAIEVGGNELINTIYPNPAREVLHVNLSGQGDLAQIRIFDAMGRPIQYTYTRNGALITIPTAEFNRGLYVVQIINGMTTHAVRVVLE